MLPLAKDLAQKLLLPDSTNRMKVKWFNKIVDAFQDKWFDNAGELDGALSVLSYSMIMSGSTKIDEVFGDAMVEIEHTTKTPVVILVADGPPHKSSCDPGPAQYDSVCTKSSYDPGSRSYFDVASHADDCQCAVNAAELVRDDGVVVATIGYHDNLDFTDIDVFNTVMRTMSGADDCYEDVSNMAVQYEVGEHSLSDTLACVQKYATC